MRTPAVACAVSLFLVNLLWDNPAFAQVAADGSLSTRVNTSDNRNFVIEDGDRAGDNLFHSFREFSVPRGGSVRFNNAPTVRNIFSRVTGDRISTLDGLLSANGAANVFLLNPNGIILGANAQLDIGGSLVVSTGDRFLFNEGSFASQPTASTAPLLLVSAPIGLQMGAAPGAIAFQDNPALQLAPGRSLLLVGGNLELNGGNVLAPGGRIELAGIADNQIIGIQPAASLTGPTLGLAVADTVRRSNVTLNGTQLTVNAPVGGTIAFYANQLNLNQATLTAGVFGTGSPTLPSGDIRLSTTGDVAINRSSISNIVAPDAIGRGGNIWIETRSLTNNLSIIGSAVFGQGATGDITVNASGDVVLNGSGSFNDETIGIISSVRPGGRGNAGNITVNAENLRLNNVTGIYTGTGGLGNAGDITLNVGSLRATRGGFLGADTEGQGNGGNITINARDAVVFDGESRTLFPSGISTVVRPEATGNAGNLTIRTNTLQLSRGALFASGTQGRGNGANITINVRDRISLFTRPDTEIPSYIASTVEPGAVGEGGTVRIRTRSLSMQNPTAITTRTTGQGNGGNLFIRAEELTVRDGSTIFTSTFGPGQAGDLTVNVGDRLTLAGSNPAFIQRLAAGQLGRFGERFDGAGTVSGLFASGSTTSTGQGGNLSVRAGTLVMEDGAQISVSSQGRGGAGNLAIAAEVLRLTNASLQADTQAGNQGSINVQTSRLVLRQNSRISTNASGDASGGNITLTTPSLIAQDNSDITANARNSFGGRITIASNLVLGTSFRSQVTPESDITASSELGAAFSGTVQFTAPTAELSQNFVTLPAEVLDPNQQVVSACDVTAGSRFVATGRGGIPVNPTQMVGSDRPWADLRELPTQAGSAPGSTADPATSLDASAPLSSTSVVEATGIGINAEGLLELIASSANPARNPTPATCSAAIMQ